MKQSKNKEKRNVASLGDKPKVSRASLNAHTNKFMIFIFSIACIAACAWVWLLGRRAQQVVTVAMTNENLYKNEQINNISNQFKAYDMTELEYEKYAPIDSNGVQTQRIVLYKDIQSKEGLFMSYYVPKEVIVMHEMFTTERVKNTDTVLYSFPGKEILPLQLGTNYLTNFKTYLETGDKINIDCTYTEETEILKSSAYVDGNGLYDANDYEKVEQIYTDTVFKNVQIADILNSDGNSVLDLNKEYEQMTLADQAALDDDEDYQKSLQPATILLALTPQEIRTYYKYLAKDGTFRMSLPQRTE